ncbi:hypothetical protein [Parendozoicomonas sp. Alg238-R29]|uniref:hypothetical protein n=1 Tax=Parendozoicomonas sp. Alg238-R29 TaxID=2993446 RepID=UPI00248E6843|nr:hypothetical protein [Parendozoicomonas sp. Alg238-R29]
MKNKLADLNNHLFAQLERLNDESVKGNELQEEIQRSQAVSNISKEIVSNASLQLNALKLQAEHRGLSRDDIPQILALETK